MRPDEVVCLSFAHGEILGSNDAVTCNGKAVFSGADRIDQMILPNPVVKNRKKFSAADVLNILAEYAAEMCCSDSVTQEDRASRLIALTALKPLIVSSKLTKLQNALLADQQFFEKYDLCPGNPSWLFGQRGSSVCESPFTVSHVLLALSKTQLAGSRLLQLRSILDFYRYRDVLYSQFWSKPQKDESTLAHAYNLYVLTQLPDVKEMTNPPRYGYLAQDMFDEFRDQAAIEKAPLEAICLAYLATKFDGGQTELAMKLASEVQTRAEESQNCTEGEIYYCHDSHLKQQASLLEALTECDAHNKRIADILNDIGCTLNDRKELADSDIAAVAVAISRYITATNLPLRIGVPTVRLSKRSFPESLINAGFAVRRRYEAATPQSKVWLDERGIWHAKRGSIVRCVINFVPSKFAGNVMLSDWFPSGCSTGQTSLGDSDYIVGVMYNNNSADWDFTRHWVQKTQANENRVDVFGTNLPAQKYSYDYTMRAEVAGSFVVPASLARCPFDQMVNGCSASDRFVIE